MKIAEMKERFNLLAAEMSTLYQKEERSADEESRLDSVIAEFNDLGEKLTKEQNRAAAVAQANSARQSQRVSGIVPQAGAEEAEKQARKIDTRSMGRRFADSEQLKRYREAGAGSGKSDPFEVKSFYHREASPLVHTEDMTPQELRALVYTGALPNDYIQPQFVPGFFRGDDLEGSLRSVLINGQTTSDAITFFRETSATNNAAVVGQATATTGTSGLKPESGLAFAQATEAVKTIATWIPITRQTLWDASQMETYVNQRLMDFLRLEESDQILNGDGVGENFTGLLNTSGVQDLDTTVYFTGSPVADAGSANENYNRIRRAKTLIRTVGRARANFVVVNPEDSESFDTATNANNNYYGAGPFSGNGVPNLWGLRVVEDENIAAGSALVGDGRMAAIWDRMQAQIMTGYINDQLVRNMLTLLAEERLALTVFRPQAFAVVELV